MMVMYHFPYALSERLIIAVDECREHKRKKGRQIKQTIDSI